MNPDELIPCSLAAFRTGISALLFQDVLDCLSADAANSQLTELTRNPRVTEVCSRSNVTNQFAQIAARPTPLHTLPASFFCADPAMKCGRRDDADQCIDIFAQPLAHLQQSTAFLRRRVDLFRDSRSQNPVLFLQVLEVMSQKPVRRGGKEMFGVENHQCVVLVNEYQSAENEEPKTLQSAKTPAITGRLNIWTLRVPDCYAGLDPPGCCVMSSVGAEC